MSSLQNSISENSTAAVSTPDPDKGFDFKIFNSWIKTIYICAGSLGVSGNALVILVILMKRRMRTSYTNIYILNQSVMDFCAALFLILLSVIESDGRRFETFADDLYCRLWLTKFPLWTTLVCSTYSLIALTIDRYLAVVHPIWHRNNFRRWEVLVAMTTISWLCGIVSMLVYFIPSCGIENGMCMMFYFWSSPTSQQASSILITIYQFFLPVFVHAYCYIRMAVVLLKKQDVFTDNYVNTGPNSSTNTTVTNDHKTRAGRNVIKTLAVVTLCFFGCWVTNQIMWISFQIGITPIDTNGVFYHITVILIFCNCCVNPFIYVTKYKQFQEALRSCFRRNRIEQGNTVTALTNS